MGFILDENGPFTCRLRGVEVMGRDVSVVCGHDRSAGEQIRAIISAEDRPAEGAKDVRFCLKPRKVFLFDRATEARIPFNAAVAKGVKQHER